MAIAFHKSERTVVLFIHTHEWMGTRAPGQAGWRGLKSLHTVARRYNDVGPIHRCIYDAELLPAVDKIVRRMYTPLEYLAEDQCKDRIRQVLIGQTEHLNPVELIDAAYEAYRELRHTTLVAKAEAKAAMLAERRAAREAAKLARETAYATRKEARAAMMQERNDRRMLRRAFPLDDRPEEVWSMLRRVIPLDLSVIEKYKRKQ